MLLFLVFLSAIQYIYTYNFCNIQENLICYKSQSNQSTCNIRTTTTTTTTHSRDCSQVGFLTTDNLKYNFGDISLKLQEGNVSSHLSMAISLPDVKWKKAFLRLSEYVDPSVCKLFTVTNQEKVSINNLFYICSWHNVNQREPKSYLLELKAESDVYFAHRKILYDIPNLNYFNDNVPLSKRLIFSYIDFTNIHKIVLIIQPLPDFYKVQNYKVEVFKEKNGKSHMLDVRLLAASKNNDDPSMTFEHFTYSEEGYHYFAISVISDDCIEDACRKTWTAKLYISRRGTPLVIGIVGASFLIPFVLFSFYMWNCRYRYHAGVPDTVEKILILFKPSFEKHNEVVATLAKMIKNLTGIEVMLDPVNSTQDKEKDAERWCSDNLILATHIIYINPPLIEDNQYELDYMTYTFLKEETRKFHSDKKIMVLTFPYSSRDIPSVLLDCVKFELIDDITSFLNVFQLSSNYSNYQNNINYIELMEKIKLAVVETEKYMTAVPTILVTNTDDPTENNLNVESGEVDVLL